MTNKNDNIPVRQALRKAFAKLDMARDTGNRDLQAQSIGFIREYWPKRNQPHLKVFFQPR